MKTEDRDLFSKVVEVPELGAIIYKHFAGFKETYNIFKIHFT